MPRIRPILTFAASAIVVCACGTRPEPVMPKPEIVVDGLRHQEILPLAQQNYAYRWLEITLEACARDVERIGAQPTVLSRQMFVWANAMFDAWAAYDSVAVGTRLGAKLRRPAAEHTAANKREAISYASFLALCDQLPHHVDYLRSAMHDCGYDPDLVTRDPARPAGIGRIAAEAVLAYRHHDGANQLGDELGSDGSPYSDYTYYRPVNPPDRILDPDRWQPIPFRLADGTTITPGFLTPQWYRVKPFVIESSAQFRPGPPPTTQTNDALLREQTDAVLHYNQTLEPEQKAIVEFMRDGPRSTGQSGHWLRFAQDVSRRDRHGLDDDVKLFFTVAGTAFDAFIACWETKRFYDSSRPWTLVRYYYRGQRILGWAGPKGGVVELPAEEWYPYSPYSFVTPPFPGYTSGHATVSGACAKILELFTGSDEFGVTEVRNCCSLTEVDVGVEVALDLPTFSGTAEIAALSRAMGGYHIPIDNEVGLACGRKLAAWSWPHYRDYWQGSAKVRR
ncbi:MAG: vanadium-dependent haloperoxidase [Planctomycetes bacterium]|nr:vanadium-dependent haloperoxidase [Planctomycetota bacterium]